MPTGMAAVVEGTMARAARTPHEGERRALVMELKRMLVAYLERPANRYRGEWSDRDVCRQHGVSSAGGGSVPY